MLERLKLSENGSRDASATRCTPGIASIRRATSLQYLLAALRGVAQHVGVGGHDRKSVGWEADVGLACGEQTADEQPRRDEQDDRHGYLADDEHVARGPAPPADPCAGRVSLQIPDQVGASRAQCRRQAGEDAGEKRDASREAEDARIQPEIERQRDRNWQVERGEQPRQPGGQHQADAGAQDTENHAFGQELTDEAAAAGTDGEADGDLSLTTGGACEQHPGHVRAGDDQH